MQNLSISVASQLHQTTILNLLVETQAWLWEQGLNQWTLPFEAEWIDKSVEAGEFFVATRESKVIAVFRLTEIDSLWTGALDHAFYIHSLAIRQEWRGRGIGFTLLEWIAAYAVKNKKGYLRLDCMADNLRLCRFYEQAGFEKCGIREIENDGDVYKAQLFEQKLSLII